MPRTALHPYPSSGTLCSKHLVSLARIVAMPLSLRSCITPRRKHHGIKDRLKLKKIVELCFYLKYHNPGIPNIVKVDGTLVRVGVSCTAHVVVLVPVDTHATDVELLPDWVVVIIIVLVQTTLMAPLLQGRDLVTAHDSIVSWQRADKGHLIIFLRLVIRWQDNVTLSARLKNTVIILLQQMFSHQGYCWSCRSDRDGTD